MKVALVCGNHAPKKYGGSTISAHALAGEMRSQCEPTIVCGDAHGDQHHVDSRRVVELGPFPYISFHPTGADRRMRLAASVRLIEFFKNATNYCRNSDFDIVDAQGPWCEASSVVTVRFVYLEYLRILRDSGYEILTGDPWSEALIDLERRTYTASSVRKFIAVSTKTRNELVGHYGISPSNIAIINNGYDPKVFSPGNRSKLRHVQRRSLGLGNETLLIGYCGNNLIRKNLRVFLEVARPFYGKGVRLAFLANDVERCGLLRKEDIAATSYARMTPNPAGVLAAIDILVFPTIYDTCAKIVIESMAMGVPVVVSRQSGLADNVVCHGRNGFVVDDPFDVATFQGIVGELIQEGESRSEIGRMAARDVAGKFEWSRVADETLAVYRSVLALPR